MRVSLLPILQRRLTFLPRPGVCHFKPQFRTRFHAKSHANNLVQSKLPITNMDTLKGKPLDRTELDNLLRRTLFYTPSFEIYGAVSGFYDYGPPGTALNANIINLWRRHFVMEENMLELEYGVM